MLGGHQQAWGGASAGHPRTSGTVPTARARGDANRISCRKELCNPAGVRELSAQGVSGEPGAAPRPSFGPRLKQVVGFWGYRWQDGCPCPHEPSTGQIQRRGPVGQFLGKGWPEGPDREVSSKRNRIPKQEHSALCWWRRGSAITAPGGRRCLPGKTRPSPSSSPCPADGCGQGRRPARDRSQSRNCL